MEAVDAFSNISKAEILRGIVAEKLTTAAQEILAVVERTVAGYEEEASGMWQEIDRQRRQLEVLLQPRVKLETIGRCETAFSPVEKPNDEPGLQNCEINVCLRTVKPTNMKGHSITTVVITHQLGQHSNSLSPIKRKK